MTNALPQPPATTGSASTTTTPTGHDTNSAHWSNQSSTADQLQQGDTQHTTSPRGRRSDGWQRGSNTCMPSMVCSPTAGMQSSPTDGNRRSHQCVWVEVGLHEDRATTGHGHPLLRLRRLTTYPVGHTTGRTRLQHHPEWASNSHQQQRLWSNIKEEGYCLYFLPVKTTTSRAQKLDVHQTPDGIKATVSPVTLTPKGAQWVTHNNDVWMYNNQGYLVRLHRRQRRALYTPDQQCPVPEDELENYRRTIAHKADGTTEDFVEQYKDLGKQMIRKRLPGPTWSGESWFRVKQDVKPPPPPLPKGDTKETRTPTTSNTKAESTTTSTWAATAATARTTAARSATEETYD